jgi:hypothetical protein
VQAECMRGLGAWHGGLWVAIFPWAADWCLVDADFHRFMAASKVLGEESVREQS